jgi:hypothetical protein
VPIEPRIDHILAVPAVEAKLRDKHFLTLAQIRRAVSRGAHDRAAWDDSSMYGERLVVTGTTDETGPLIAYLRPIESSDGTWECLTAWRID